MTCDRLEKRSIDREMREYAFAYLWPSEAKVKMYISGRRIHPITQAQHV